MYLTREGPKNKKCPFRAYMPCHGTLRNFAFYGPYTRFLKSGKMGFFEVRRGPDRRRGR